MGQIINASQGSKVSVICMWLGRRDAMFCIAFVSKVLEHNLVNKKYENQSTNT